MKWYYYSQVLEYEDSLNMEFQQNLLSNYYQEISVLSLQVKAFLQKK